MRVSGALGGGEAGVEAGDCLGCAAEFGKGLRRHLIGGDVIGVVLDESCKLGEGGVGVALREVFHGEAVAREGVGGVELEDVVERGELVHRGILAGYKRQRLNTDLHRFHGSRRIEKVDGMEYPGSYLAFNLCLSV
jgi:hypothetical protein